MTETINLPINHTVLLTSKFMGLSLVRLPASRSFAIGKIVGKEILEAVGFTNQTDALKAWDAR